MVAGVVKGLWYLVKEVAVSIWEAVKDALEPVVDLFTFMYDTVKEALSPLNDLLLFGGDAFSLIDVIAGAFKFLGKVIGFLIKIIGKIVKVVLKVITTILKPLVLIIGGIIGGIVDIIKPIIESASEWIVGVGKILKGIFTLDPATLWEGIKQTFFGMIKTIGSLILGVLIGIPKLLAKTIEKVFMWIGSLADDLQGPFGALLRLILAPFKFIGFLAKAIWNTLGGVYDVIMGIFTFDWERIKKGAWEAISNIPMMLWEAAKGITKRVLDALEPLKKLAEIIIWPFQKTYELVSWIINLLGYLTSPAKWMEGFTSIGTMIFDTLSSAFSKLVDYIIGLIPGASTIISAGTAVKDTAASVWNSVGDFLSSINPFADGTNNIQNDGLAIVHKGESIVPEKYAAKGNGPFSLFDKIQGLATGFVPNVSEGMSDIIPSSLMGGISDFISSLFNSENIQTKAAEVSAKPVSEVYDRMQAERASTNSQDKGTELSQIAVATSKSVDYLAMLHEDTQRIIALMTPLVGTSNAGSPSTKTQNKVPITAPDYGTWQFGRNTGNASKQVISTGT